MNLILMLKDKDPNSLFTLPVDVSGEMLDALADIQLKATKLYFMAEQRTGECKPNE